ncbi:RNA polymerase sigma factor [Aliiglaciecola sp. M165]|uniref:RNA polymerase sigma factor n=1 Tax=Aliiglaciecola sp. M165 TaxID=2593649 RepID=UPI00117C0EAF|nr:sigma-70 family RNA polymerase sigma factor [Aliiglaciecola sp. M165]TRY33826.1 sigma-70 family RNA polymerase sigma factor [Aliiglaciecola sp. M165]
MNTQGNVVEAHKAFAEKSERDLIAAVQQGDRKAYQTLYQTYIGQVYALCFRLTSDQALAEDAAQEVFIQLWRKIGNFKGDSKFSTWLHTVTSNITISYLRKQRGWWQRMFNIEDSEAMHHAAEQQTDLGDLEGYVARLPERARIVFVLHAIEGYRHEDIAKMMDMAVGSSKAQFHRAKHLLKEWMGYE